MSERKHTGSWPALLPAAFLIAGTLLAVPLSAAQEAAEVQDPMRPPQTRQTESSTSAPSWDLSSILISDNRRLAVINGVLVKPGERVSGARLVRIAADHVVIRHAGGEQTLSLRSNLSISRSSSQ